MTVRRYRRLMASLLMVAVAGTLTACGEPDKEALRELQTAIARTSQLSHRFVYSEETADSEVGVEGLVEDDFRYKARLSFAGTPAYDEIVLDDLLAARILHPVGAEIYATDQPQSEEAEAGLVTLASNGWVVDPAGAPNLLASSNERTLGGDPVIDALDVLRYLDEVALRENVVVEFDPFDFDYRAKEDPFEQPEEGSGVIRYDIRGEDLPKAEDSRGGNQAVPETADFRKMAIYVKDGLIVRIQEDIDVVSRLDEIERNYDIKFDDDASDEDKVRISIDAINAVRRGQGSFPIRVRTMSLDLIDLGERITVEPPKTIVAQADLSVLRGRGSDDLRPVAQKT